MPDRDASIAKLGVSGRAQRIANTGIPPRGIPAQLGRGPTGAPVEGRAAPLHLDASPVTIGGGASEIQHNIIATLRIGWPRGSAREDWE